MNIRERMEAAQREGQIRRELEAERRAEIERLKEEIKNSPPPSIGFRPEIQAQLEQIQADNLRREALFDDLKAEAAKRESRKRAKYTYTGLLRFR